MNLRHALSRNRRALPLVLAAPVLPRRTLTPSEIERVLPAIADTMRRTGYEP